MRRLAASLSMLAIGTLVACTPASTSGSPSSERATASAPASATESSSTSAVATQSEPATPEPSGTATDFCGAFLELQAVSEGPSNDLAAFGTQFRAAAADMRAFAPAEIEKAANTYADVIDNIGKAALSGTMDQAAMEKAMSDGMAGNAADIGTTAQWVATNCGS